tara:strand:+ start:310 stop:735 length:426 start_codon:yes stop_codon:yes gene_type:complete
MKKLFLTSAVALMTLVASAQFTVISTYDGDQEESLDKVTQNVGFGYSLNDTWTVGLINAGEDAEGETKYDLWGRYDLKNNAYVSLQAPTEETLDNLTVGLGYSYNVWKGLNVEPNYSMGLKEDETTGEREGTFNLGFSYKF